MVQHICLVGCKIQPVDGYVSVCLGLTIDVYGQSNVFSVDFPRVYSLLSTLSFFFN